MNQLIEQARTFFASMTPGARLTAGLLLAVVVVSVAFLFQQSTAGPDAYLFGAEPLTSSQMMAVEAAIGKAGLSGHMVEGNRIKVPLGKKGEYMGAIVDAGALPRSVMDHMKESLDGGGWTDSRAVKQARMKAGRERQLSQLITMMPWVQQASVLYKEEKMPGLNARSRVAATAAIQPIAGEMVDPRRARTIKQLVAGWHPSLATEGVTVIDQSDNSTYGGGESDPGDFNDPYHQALVAYENRIRGNIVQHLSYIPGVRVQVSATLDSRLNSQVRSTKPEKNPLVRNSAVTSEETTQNTVDGAGRPGLIAQGPARNGDEGPRRTNQSTVKNSDEQESVAFGDTTTVEQMAGLVPKEAQASVEVPRSYVISVWKQQQLRETGEVPENIDPQQLLTVETQVKRDLTDAVEPLLPDPPGAQDEYKTVHVSVFDTVDAEPLPEPSMASEALFFASQHANTAGMLVLGLVGLVMLRSVVNGGSPSKGASGALPSLKLQTPDGDLAGGAAGDFDDENDGPKLQLKKPESLKDDLATIVRDDPDAAAAILRGWIGAAS